MFECSELSCSYLASTRRALANHSLECHAQVKHACPRPECKFMFADRRQLNQHLRTAHRQIKPFRCTWSGCHFHALREPNLVTHVRTVHFKLPASLEEQARMGIVDNRNPHDFMEVLGEVLLPNDEAGPYYEQQASTAAASSAKFTILKAGS